MGAARARDCEQRRSLQEKEHGQREHVGNCGQNCWNDPDHFEWVQLNRLGGCAEEGHI